MTTHSSAEIRHALAADLPELLRLLRAKAKFDGCADALKASTDSLREALFADKPLAHALLAVVDGKPVGMATYFRIFSTFTSRPGFWLDDLYIDEKYRGRGIGRGLMLELSRLAVDAGCARLDWHVAHDNRNGQAFYRSIGATIFEEQRLVRLDAAAISALADQRAGLDRTMDLTAGQKNSTVSLETSERSSPLETSSS